VSTHGHGHTTGSARLSRTAARVVVGLLLACAIAVVTGAVLLWPPSQTSSVPTPLQAAGGGPFTTEAGTVRAQATGPCGGAQDTAGLLDSGPTYSNPTAFYDCTRTTIAITTGPDAGRTTTLEIAPGPGSPVLQPGDDVRLARGVDAGGATLYDFYDFSRGLPLAAIAAVFAVVVVVVARWRGLASLLGLAVAVLVMAVFVLPALLAGESALPVAVVGGAAILFAVIFLAHGVSLRTSAALLGTLASLGLSAGLSQLAVHLTHLTGQSEEQNTTVQVYAGQVSIVGLLLAGFVIGSLGVLNDVTVTQASTAFELAALDPDAPRRRVYAGAMRRWSGRWWVGSRSSCRCRSPRRSQRCWPVRPRPPRPPRRRARGTTADPDGASSGRRRKVRGWHAPAPASSPPRTSPTCPPRWRRAVAARCGCASRWRASG